MSFLATSIWFLLALLVKLCYSTALFATVAEVHRRVQVFRQNGRPTLRAIVLLPVVILFCSLVLFALWVWPLLTTQVSWTRPTLASLAWMVFRLAFLGAAVVLGAAIGIVVGRNIPMGRDRFGGVVVRNRGRYLVVWAGAFSVCGVFRLMPWGFVTYWVVWMLVLSACLVAGTHFVLHSRFRALRACSSPGLPPGGRLDLSLDAEEAVALSALVRATQLPAALSGSGVPNSASAGASLPRPSSAGSTVVDSDLVDPNLVGPRRTADAETVAGVLVAGDVAWSSHPAWADAAQALGADSRKLERALGHLASKGLVRGNGDRFAVTGDAERLSALVVADRTVALSTRTAEGTTTQVVTLHGPSAVLWEPGPQHLRVREVERTALVQALLG